jgi:uncharacterized membrane protein YfcA
MIFVIGFLIAVAIGVTGVGAGVITAPVLILFFHMPPARAVGTALAFSVAVKLLVAPVQLWRKLVDFRVLGYMLAGGLPGVFIGTFFLSKLNASGRQDLLYALIGSTIVIMASLNLYRMMKRPATDSIRDRSRWLALAMLPVGAEVGFSSAGAGALGSLALLAMTPLTAAQVVGTDLVFGLMVAFAGGAVEVSAGNYDGVILAKLVIAGLVGAAVGTNLAAIAPQRVLRAALSLWLVTLGAQLCWSGVSHW